MALKWQWQRRRRLTRTDSASRKVNSLCERFVVSRQTTRVGMCSRENEGGRMLSTHFDVFFRYSKTALYSSLPVCRRDAPHRMGAWRYSFSAVGFRIVNCGKLSIQRTVRGPRPRPSFISYLYLSDLDEENIFWWTSHLQWINQSVVRTSVLVLPPGLKLIYI